MYGLKWKKSHNVEAKSVFMPKIYSIFFFYTSVIWEYESWMSLLKIELPTN